MFQPVAAFPSIMALKEGKVRHLNPEVLSYTHSDMYNTHTDINSEHARLENLAQKSIVALTLLLLYSKWLRICIRGLKLRGWKTKTGHKLVKGSDICSHLSFNSKQKAGNTKSRCCQQYSGCSLRPKVSKPHTQTYTGFLSGRKQQARRGRVNIWGKSAINREHCSCGWQTQTLERGRQERPRYTNLQHPGLRCLDYMWENIGCVFKESCTFTQSAKITCSVLWELQKRPREWHHAFAVQP